MTQPSCQFSNDEHFKHSGTSHSIPSLNRDSVVSSSSLNSTTLCFPPHHREHNDHTHSVVVTDSAHSFPLTSNVEFAKAVNQSRNSSSAHSGIDTPCAGTPSAGTSKADEEASCFPIRSGTQSDHIKHSCCVVGNTKHLQLVFRQSHSLPYFIDVAIDENKLCSEQQVQS